jgi:hypothetical protein
MLSVTTLPTEGTMDFGLFFLMLRSMRLFAEEIAPAMKPVRDTHSV